MDRSLHKTVVVIVGFVIAVGAIAIAQIGQRVAKHRQQLDQKPPKMKIGG